MTVQIPSSQVGWFEQMMKAMGWAFKKKEEATPVEKPRVFESEVDELLSMFGTNEISEDDINRECELVREELHNARQPR